MMPIHTNPGLRLRFNHLSSRVESGEMIESPYFVGSIPSPLWCGDSSRTRVFSRSTPSRTMEGVGPCITVLEAVQNLSGAVAGHGATQRVREKVRGYDPGRSKEEERGTGRGREVARSQ